MDLESEDGRSRVVATKVRDTIRMVKPVLMRTFLQSDKPVEFVPRGPEDVAAAVAAAGDYTRGRVWRALARSAAGQLM